jgi:hypothetical protein
LVAAMCSLGTFQPKVVSRSLPWKTPTAMPAASISFTSRSTGWGRAVNRATSRRNDASTRFRVMERNSFVLGRSRKSITPAMNARPPRPYRSRAQVVWSVWITRFS